MMIFYGDTAIAHGDKFSFIGFPQRLKKLIACVNLEGAIANPEIELTRGVYNTIDWKKTFDGFRIGPVFIGNNHIEDVSDGIKKTQAHLEGVGLESFGAGSNVADACRCVIVKSGLQDYVLCGFGWSLIGCKQATKKNAGVNPLRGEWVYKVVKNLIKQFPDKRVIPVFHWNYEFEKYPQPAHRNLSRSLIDIGAYAIIGHHPHCVGPVERYKGRTIAYSLGNAVFSYGKYFKENLKFPEISFHGIAVECGDKDLVHHFNFKPPQDIVYDRYEFVFDDALSLKPEFESMQHNEYCAWFKKHRLKKRFLPIYYNSESSFGNFIRDRFVKLRQDLIDLATYFGLKGQKRSV